MPREMGFAYKDMSYQEQQAQKGIPPAAIFAVSLLFVFLILAALYESWSLRSDFAVRVPGSYQRQNPRCHSAGLNSVSASATELNSAGSRRSDPRANTFAFDGKGRLLRLIAASLP